MRQHLRRHTPNQEPPIHFDHVTDQYADLPYMGRDQAEELRKLISKHDLRDILELGFFSGKSSAYLAAILADRGTGHLTTIDLKHALKREPSIHEVLESLGLQDYVSVITATRSYTWELGKMLQQKPRPKFDLCYLDGGHTWDTTGWGFVLVDQLLKPGGWVVFDDLDWSISHSLERRGLKHSESPYRRYSQDERDAQGVRMVWEVIVPEFGYRPMRENRKLNWGVARKPRK
ncbi:MAG: class I SAM-dependent methyltransferase [Spirochaetota bacterium]